MIKTRINWIDIAKGLGIILVVLGHMNINSYVRNFIFTFHMPLFFYISGLLFNPNKFETFYSFFVSRLKRLLIPYLFFSIITIIFFRFYLKADLLNGFLSVINGRGGPSPMWFLACLFVTEILVFFIIEYYSRNKLYLISLISLIIGYILQVLQIKLFLNLDIFFSALSFFLIGYNSDLILKIIRYELKLNWFIFFSFLICIFVSYFQKQFYQRHVDMMDNFLGDPFSFYLGGISGIFFIIGISKKIGSSSILTYIGRNSLIILGVHIIIPFFLNFHFLDYFVSILGPFWGKSVIRFSSIPVIWGFIIFANRYIPALVGSK